MCVLCGFAFADSEWEPALRAGGDRGAGGGGGRRRTGGAGGWCLGRRDGDDGGCILGDLNGEQKMGEERIWGKWMESQEGHGRVDKEWRVPRKKFARVPRFALSVSWANAGLQRGRSNFLARKRRNASAVAT